MTGNKSLSAFYKSDKRVCAVRRVRIVCIYTCSARRKLILTCRKREVIKKTVLIMDEVDGMSGVDRGGMAELIQLIKHSRVRCFPETVLSRVEWSS